MTAPEVFDQDEDDGTVVIKSERPPELLHERVREAVDICPTGTLYLVEDDAQ